MLEQAEAEHRRDQRGLQRGKAARILRHRRAGHEVQRDRARREREQHQRIEPTPPEVARQVTQVRRDEILGQVADAREHVELRGQAHRPQHRERPHGDLIRRAPGHRHQSRQRRREGDLVVDDGERGITEAGPTHGPIAARLLARPGHRTEQERDLVPRPQRQRRREPDVRTRGGRHVCGSQGRVGAEPRQRAEHQKAAAVGPGRQPHHAQDHAGAEPPHADDHQHREPRVAHAVTTSARP